MHIEPSVYKQSPIQTLVETVFLYGKIQIIMKMLGFPSYPFQG